MRKTLDLLPFEAPGNLETFAEKHDASLQVTCTHQKKRPDNLIFSRTFGFKVLDMFEFGVSDYKSLSSNASNTDTDHFLRPNLIFQGEHWNLSDKLMRLRNYFIDFFGPAKYSQINITEAKKFMIFSTKSENTITVQTMECKEITEVKANKGEI